MTQGHGNSNDLYINKMAEDLYHLVLTLKHKYGKDTKCFILGHSWGGMLGTAFMINEKYQNSVDGWIESDGAHDIPLLNKFAVQLFIETANEQIDLGNSTEKWSEIKTWAEAIDTTNITDEISGEINSKGHEVETNLQSDGVLQEGEFGPYYIINPLNALTSKWAGNFAAYYLNEEVEQTSLTNQLYKIELPCLFLYGKYDFVTPYQLGISALSKVSSENKKLVIFEKSGHSPMNNEADLFVSEIVNFIDNI